MNDYSIKILLILLNVYNLTENATYLCILALGYDCYEIAIHFT